MLMVCREYTIEDATVRRQLCAVEVLPLLPAMDTEDFASKVRRYAQLSAQDSPRLS